MSFHRKSALRNLTNPPLPISTLNDMLVDGRIPRPDAYNGRTPLWTDETFEAIKQSFLDAARPHRKRAARRDGVVENNSPTT
jgi:hypothetical protein